MREDIECVRNVDKAIYLGENRYEKPKETTKFYVSLFRKAFKNRNTGKILDIGCAAGEFLYYMKNEFPSFEYFGIDISDELIEKANNQVADATFKVRSISETPYFHGETFDAIFCIGVVSIFDDIQNAINCILSAAKPGTKVFIASNFNPDPVDALIVYRESTLDPEIPWQRGQNVFSMKTMNALLDHKVSDYKWHQQKMSIPLRKQKDPMRAWTIKTEEDPHQRVYGIKLLADAYVVEITV